VTSNPAAKMGLRRKPKAFLRFVGSKDSLDQDTFT
jgi:hypothetical protein